MFQIALHSKRFERIGFSKELTPNEMEAALGEHWPEILYGKLFLDVIIYISHQQCLSVVLLPEHPPPFIIN